MLSESHRKIIHIDMDCFYAAIEIRDNPSLADKPVAVGGTVEERSVLCTCNYIARKYKVRSAMSTALAKQLCPDLIVLPVDMAKYKSVSEIIHAILLEFTSLVEPLSLDEAYLDVTHSPHYDGSATLIAEAIRKKIWNTMQLTASAGVSSNKLIAKIASGWNKPNGIWVVPPKQIDAFVKQLTVDELYGVGKVTAEKLHGLGFKTCADLQTVPLNTLTQYFGEKTSSRLYEQCRGIDYRMVEPNRARKSVSVEHTFKQDIILNESCLSILQELYDDLLSRLKKYESQPIKNQHMKIKLSNFKLITLERSSQSLSFPLFKDLLLELISRSYGKIRLMGIGVHFLEKEKTGKISGYSRSLFEE